jgi:hypothetical protein
VTHVGWDDFTHEGRWGVRQVAWLSAEHGALPGYKWLQYGMSVAGLVVVAAAIVAHLRALPRRAQRPRWHPSGSVALPAAVFLPAAVVVAAGAGAVVGLANVPQGLHAVAFRGVVTSVLALVAGLLLVAVGWQVAMRRPTAEESV